jgi:hypothetical protein
MIKLIPLAQRRNADFENDRAISCGTVQRQRDPIIKPHQPWKIVERKIWSSGEACVIGLLQHLSGDFDRE